MWGLELGLLHMLTFLIPTATQLPFIGGETEAERGELACLGTQSKKAAEPRFQKCLIPVVFDSKTLCKLYQSRWWRNSESMVGRKAD